MANKAHAMYQAQADIPFVYCGNCGAWGHKRTRRLSLACGPPAASGLQALSRIRRGQHPLQRRGPGGVLLPREAIRTSARYCAHTAAWIPTDGYDAGGVADAFGMNMGTLSLLDVAPSLMDVETTLTSDGTGRPLAPRIITSSMAVPGRATWRCASMPLTTMRTCSAMAGTLINVSQSMTDLCTRRDPWIRQHLRTHLDGAR